MSLYVLDTDTLTLLEKGNPVVCQRVASHPATEIAITVISVEEQLDGWHAQLRRKQTPEALARVYDRLARTVQFLGRVPILSFSEAAIHRFEELRALKLNVGGWDLRIAAITLENKATLVTRNVRDFQRIPNLVFENWAE